MAAITKGQRTRARLLEAAVERFASDGYRATSVSAVAREVGLTPAAAYAYFKNKDELFADAVDLDAATLIEEAEAAATSTEGPRQRLLEMIVHLMASLERHPLARRVLSGQEPEVAGRLLGLPALQALRRTAAADLRAGQAAGTVRSDVDPEIMAMGVETVVLAILMAHLQVAGAAPDAEARAQAVFAVLDSALRPG
jgi:AcrR family transcriptional regulator